MANNIVYYRLQKDWSQEDLADKLGTTTNYISRIENSKHDVGVDYIENLSKLFNIQYYQLFEIREQVVNNRRRRKSQRRPKNM